MNLDAIYPQYQQSLSSPSSSIELDRCVITLFFILQIVLRGPKFSSDAEIFPRKALDEHVFLLSMKFAQLSDEEVGRCLEDPVSIADGSSEWMVRNAVRIAVLSCANEHFDLSFADLWLRYYDSIRGE